MRDWPTFPRVIPRSGIAWVDRCTGVLDSLVEWLEFRVSEARCVKPSLPKQTFYDGPKQVQP